MNSGVYLIQIGPTGKYVGSSSNVDKRWRTHLLQLKKKEHHCLPLQRAFDKYGKDQTIFSLILKCSEKDLLYFEQRAIQVMTPSYNVAKEAGRPMAGRKHSEETKAKMRMSNGSVASRARQSAIMKNKPSRPTSLETAAKIRYSRARRVLCIETGHVFNSPFDAGQWCIETGLTNAKTARININQAIRIPSITAYGFHWANFNNKE